MKLFKSDKYLFVLACLSLLLLFADLSKGDLTGYDDALYAHEGRHMIESGDWWTVQFNGSDNYQFPPVFMWLEALSMKVWGFTDFAAKFPSALLGFGALILTYFIALELTRDVWLSRIAMAVLMTTQYFMKYAKHAMTDAPFIFFFAAALLLYLKAYRNPRWILLCGIPVGLAILTRPAVGFLFLPVCFGHMVAAWRWNLLKSWHWIGGAAVAIAIPSVWYVSQYHLHGAAFLSLHFSVVTRKVSSPGATSYFQYAYLMLRLYWPWLPFLVIGIVGQTRRWFQSRDFCAAFLLSWVICIVGPFSIAAQKVLRYIIPAFPAFAILAAMPVNHWLPERRKEQCFKGLFLLGGMAVIFMLFVPMTKLRATDMKKLGPIAAAHMPPGQRLILYSGGRPDFDYQNEFLWYANRNVDLLMSLADVKQRLSADPSAVAIIDKESFANIPAQVLAESERFVCVTSPNRTITE